ncbi:hypothetical protein ACIU0H_24065 [Pseudomonas aeruginosa]
MGNEDISGIERHLESPEVSLGEHVQRRQLELADELDARRAIYLDLKFWIILRDVLMGQRTRPEEMQLLQTLRKLVEEKRAFCPISETTFVELLKQQDLATRRATGELIDELGLGVSLISFEERMQLEIASFIYKHTGQKEYVSPDRLVWSKLSYVLGHTHPYQTGFEPAVELAIQKAFFDRMWHASLSEILQLLGNSIPPGMGFDALAQSLNAGNIRHADELRSFKQTYAIELAGGLSLVAPIAAEVVARMGEKATGRSMPRHGDEWDAYIREWQGFLMAAFKRDQVKDALPTIHINTCLHAAVRWNKVQRYEANDFHDFHHAVAALAYCDVFLTERGLKAMVTASHVALDARYSCQVAATVRDGLALLHQLQ